MASGPDGPTSVSILGWSAWTDHVADNGTASIDSLQPATDVVAASATQPVAVTAVGGITRQTDGVERLDEQRRQRLELGP